MENTTNIEKMSVWEKIAEEDLFQMLKEMGYGQKRIEKFQKKRFIESILIFVLFMIVGFQVSYYAYAFAIVGSLYLYRSKYKRIQRNYQLWKFNRHLEFTKFIRLLVPYLMQSKGEVALYTIFNKILLRIEKDVDRNSLFQLMSEMSDRPNEVEPFIDYAERSSGTDMSILFMSTIYDFKQATFDTEVINELGKISSEELMSSIDDIIHMKLRRFGNFSTKITMTSFVLFIGYAITFVIDLISQFFG